jgi:hypothetical protein
MVLQSHVGQAVNMSADNLTRPERAAQIRQAKRYKAEIRKRGTCMACQHRDRSATFWGRSICRIGDNRQHPQCERDGKGLRFEFDPAVLEQFKDAA